MFKKPYILPILLACCFAFTGCGGGPTPASVISRLHYIKLIHMDVQSQSAQSQMLIIDGYLTNWWLADDAVSLKKVNDRYFAIGIFYDVVLVDINDFKPVKEYISKPTGSKNNFLYPWYRVRNTYTRPSWRGLTSASLLKQSTLQALQFKDPLHPSFQAILNLSAQRIDSTHYRTHDIMIVQPYQGRLEVSAKTLIYDLVTDSLNTQLYANPYYETVSLYTGITNQDYSLKSDFHPDLPYHTIDYNHFQGLLGDHYAFLTTYDHVLYVQDLSKDVTRKIHDDVLRNVFAVADDQLFFATSNKIFQYDPSTNQTEALYTPEAPFYVNDLSLHFDAASDQLFAIYAQNVVKNYVNDGYWVRCIRIDLADKSITDLYSERCTGIVRPLISNFIQINGQYYTTISSHDPL